MRVGDEDGSEAVGDAQQVGWGGGGHMQLKRFENVTSVFVTELRCLSLTHYS